MFITKKLKWFGHVTRSYTMSKTLLYGTIDGKKGEGGLKLNGNIISWNCSGLRSEEAMLRTKNREG